MSRSQVYAAHALSCYGSAHEAICLARVARLLADWEVIDAAGRYRTNAG